LVVAERRREPGKNAGGLAILGRPLALDAAAAAEREETLLAIRGAGRKKKRKGH